MKPSNCRWLSVITVICASSVFLTGCKSSSWSQLPGMSYFAGDDKPEASYYGSQEAPSNEHAATTSTYSERYGNTAGNNPAQNTYGQQYANTNIGHTNYLTDQPQHRGQTATYANQNQNYPQQYQGPNSNYNTALQPQPGTNYQNPGAQQLIQQNGPSAGTLQDTTTGNFNNGGFYDGNANVGTYNPAQNPAQNDAFLPTGTTPQDVRTYNTSPVQNSGAAAYISEAPDNTQFDGGNYQLNPTNTAPMQDYRPGSTGDTNSYYNPTGGNFGGK